MRFIVLTFHLMSGYVPATWEDGEVVTFDTEAEAKADVKEAGNALDIPIVLPCSVASDGSITAYGDPIRSWTREEARATQGLR